MTKIFLIACVLCAAAMQAQDYTLVWNEDFTDGALDTKVWLLKIRKHAVWLAKRRVFISQTMRFSSRPHTIRPEMLQFAFASEADRKEATMYDDCDDYNDTLDDYNDYSFLAN